MIFILDKSMNIRDSLSNSGEISHITPFFDDIYTSYLETGAETYQFSTLANTKESQHLIVGNHIAFQYEDEYKLFTITEIEETHDENFIKTVYCEMAGLKLINKVIRPMTFSSTNLRKFLEEILSDTDWNIGALDIGLNNVCDIEVKDYTNAYSLLQTHIRESYKGEIHFTVKFEGSKATKYINVYSNRGQFDGFRFSYDSNLTSITRTINFDDLATALIGVGNNGLTFKEIETEDKPLNQDFITDESAYLLWNDNGSHILGYEKFDTDSPQELLKLTREKLKERCQPKIKYELNPELLGEAVKIGDTVYVIDNEFNPPIHLSARINQLSISLTDKSNNSCVLSNFTEITSNITEEMRQIASQLEGYVDGQFPIGGDKIQDGAIDGDKLANGQIIQGTHIFANSIQADHIQAETIDTKHLKADSIISEHIQSNSINTNHLNANSITSGHIQAGSINASHIQSNTIDTNHLKSNIIDAGHINANSITSEHIQSNTISSDHIQTGSITAGSGIIADGAIGNAQISKIDAGKIEAGTIDTSKVTVQGSNGHLRIKGNRLQVFNGTGNQAKERVSVGDVNGDGTVYGLRVRGEDGQTVLLDENGVTSEGITDGSITNEKISDDANIDGAKLNINSVVSKINEDGTETIQGTKIEVDGTTLNTKLSTITNKQTEDGERITQAQSQITANTNAIKLKVDEQTYTTDKKDMTSKLEKNTSEISTMKGQIALKVEQTDIENAKSELEGTIDSKINTAKADIKITTDAIKQNVSNLTQTVSNKADGSTVSSLNSKVSSLETSVNGISGKVTSLEKTTTTLGTQVNAANTNASSALNKANSATTTANNAQNTANTNKSNITDLQGEVNTVKSNVASLEVTTSGISQKVSSVESTTATLSGKVNTANNNATNALNKANSANTLADSKAKVFTSTPTVPYKVGDLWVQGTSGDVMKCKTARASGSYTASDWEKASKYTDDTKANAVDGKVATLQGTVNTTNSKVATLETNLNGITQRVSSTESITATLTGTVNNLKSPSAMPYQKDLIIYGESNKYYPVYIRGGNQDVLRTIKIWRSYYEQAPSDWYTSTHKGSLMFTWQGNFGGWGGASYKEYILENSSEYTTLLADCKISVHSMGYTFFLRGGGTTGAVYHFGSDQTINPEVYYNGASDKVYDNDNDIYDVYAFEPLTTVNTTRLNNMKIARESSVSAVNSKVATIETNLNGITQRVSSTESTVSTHTTQLGTVDNRINTAKNSAISTAANDATTKANNAQTNAKSYTDGQITTVNKTITDKVAEIKTTTDAITSRVSKAEQVASSSLQGKMLYTDPTFKSGNNSIGAYNNAGGGTVTVSRVAKSSDCPTTSGYMLQIKTTGTASPGHGGFYFATGTRANAILITKIIAKIPSGCTLNWASNGYGTGGKQEWLTSTAGTGNWQEYICKVTCGTSGTFSSTNYFYLSGGITPITWYVAMATVFDITDTSNIESRLSTAESKITDTAITNVVKQNFYTKSETNSQITSKGYQTESQVQQTVNGLQVKFQESGGYNLIYNGNFKKDLNNWNISGDASKVLISSTLSCSANQKGVRIEGTLKNAVWVHQSVPWDSNEPITLSYWQHTTANGSDGTTNPFRATQVVLSYTDGTSSWHTNSGQSKYNTWEKISHTITPDSGKRVRSVQVDLWCRDTTKMVYYTNVMLEKGSLATEYTPNPNEIYAGITTIDKEGITVKQSNISTYTTIDASSFRVENNTGGTVAEFSQNSQIPNLTAGIINANEIYSPNICTKSPMSGSIKYIVNGSTGNDNNNGTTYSTPFKTVAKAVSMLNTQQDRSVDIEIYGSVTGFDVKGINGTGAIRFYFSDDAIVNGAVIIGGITNTIGFHGGSSDKPTFKNGISIYRCRDVEIGSLTFRGTNSNGNNIYLEDVTFARIISCDLGGLSTQLLCAIQARRSNLWIYNCRGSKITDVVAQSEFSIAYAPRAGTSNVPDYSNAFLCNYDGAGRIHNWSGGNFVKTPSKGWNPAYTPTQKTQTWSFNKIWSDETLNGWSDRQELIQGYSSTWNTGRWTGYMQFTDGMAAIRSAISGGTNLSGRLYVQRRTSSGNSTGSKLCLYASDGTLITNSTTINRGQGVWVNLSSAIISKIASGVITYFYLKADSNNSATYFKCESNAKIEITYTK